MPQNTNLNVSPYFDDFNENKNYHKVLFKPGFPVQARELTTLQSILQNQVEKFGRHFFKEGSMVIPGGTFYDPSYFAVKINPNFLNIPVNSYTKFLADNKIKIKGETSGVEATVVNRLTASESIDGFDTLYVKYSKSGSDGITKTFQDGENLITLSGITFLNTSIAANSQFASCIVANATSTGSSFSVNEGVYFIRGFFVKTIASTVILDQYNNSPSYRVGFLIKEEKTGASSTNSDLYDNALGFSNEAAPGADRLKISLSVHKKSLTDINDKDFVELMRVENGSVKEIVNKTEYNVFAEELARRTRDESGDYYVRPFSIDVKESLNDRIGNRGIYFDNQQTQNGNTPSDDILSLQVSSGKAYVRGYEVNKDVSTSIDVLKPRTTKLEENISVPVRIGKSMEITNILGSPPIGFTATPLKLLDRRLDANKSADDGATIIGNARAYDYSQKTSTGIAVTTFDLKFYDMQLYTVVGIATVLSHGADAHVKGKYSGAVGYAALGAKTNVSTITVRDVIGEFQINEPLIVNGIEIGNNITSIVDNSFEDIKSVHSDVGVVNGVGSGTTTFAANLVLDREKQLFKTAAEFNIAANGVVTGPSIQDFRSVVKENDIISYSAASDTDVPRFLRVSAVDSNGANFTVVGVATVSGVCNGDILANTPTDLNLRIPTLNEADDPGFRVKLADDFVASMNVLDSSYIIRKQISKSNYSGSQVTFNISDVTGLSTDDLFFEPFTTSNYTLEIDTTSDLGFVETLRDPMVEVATNGKSVVIKGLSKASGDAVLTVAIRRSKLASKEKSIVRCSDLIVSKSESTSSGIGTTSLDDGLTYSQYYGTRVQDEEISLNVPEVSRILAIFESNDTNNPDLPTLIATDATATFTGNVTVGEQFIGGTSGAVARVVSVVSGTSISFVYENQNTFEIGENISLKTSGIFATLTSVLPGDRNLINNYILDDGQRLEFADFSRIVRKSDSEKPTRKLRIIFDYLLNNENSGTIETVNSYNTLSYSKDIPFVFDRFASDFIDFRPRVAPFTANNKSPFAFGSRSFASTQSEVVVSNKSVVVDYSYYQGRADRLYLTKDGFFTVKQGTPSRLPKLPLPNDEAFEVASIIYPPYVRNAIKEVKVKRIKHKRYTMKDIGSLEHRIKNLENYTTLSLLETDTKNLSIKDPNTGLDKFKSGFFVDNFTSHAAHNLTGESKFDIDLVRGECRPRSTERNVPLIHETVSTLNDPVNADYNWVEDFVDANITRNGPALLLNYTETEFLTQPFATRTENLNPFHIALFSGTIELNPESDFWVEEVPLGNTEVFNIDGTYNAFADLLGVPNNAENGGMASSFWNSHEITWNGLDSATLLGEEITDTEILASSTEQVSQAQGHGTAVYEVTNQTIQNTVTQTFEQTGIEKEFGLELTPTTETIDLGNKVVGIDVLYNVRSRNIEVSGKKLKPNTRYYVFMENQDMTEYAVPKLLPVVMTKGSFSTGDLMYSVENPPGTAGKPSIHFRLCSSNHKKGPFNEPTETYTTNPYDSTSLPSTYSSTSTILNVDTGGLSHFTKADHIGYVKKGMNLVNKDGDAEATISDLSLVSDEKGNLIFSLHIPDPTVEGNPLFTTGNNTIRITTSQTNASVLDPGESSAETEYLATGYQTNTQEQTLNIKTAQIDKKQIGSDQPVTQIVEVEGVVLGPQDIQTSEQIDYYDPLAQSFLVEKSKYQDGVFITGGELFFKTKDNEVPVTVQIRTMRDGAPTTTILPFGTTQIDPADVNAPETPDPTAATNFKFNTPVYLQGGYEYALVLVAPTEKYLAYITRMGEEDLILQSISNTQPYLGSLFKSQNSSTWTPSQYEDLKFKLNKAQFVVNTPSSVLLPNSELQLQKIRRENPAIAYSKRLNVSIASTTTSFGAGSELKQGTNTGRITASGGAITTGTSKVDLVPNTGIGLTQGTFSGIGFTSLTGFGQGATATVSVQAGGALGTANINITNGGTGYQAGDLLLMNSVGFNGSGVRVVVKNTTNTNLLVVDNVKDTFVDNADMTHITTSGVNVPITAANITGISSDPIRDGYTLKINHRNHGMHSSTNKVRVSNFHPDVKPTLLTSNINDDSTTIDLTSGTDFTTFEGTAVGAGHTGYLLVNQEIIAYNAISNNQITITTRSVDSSLKSNHDSSTLAHKYEFNGVSLRKINKDHNIDPREKTFDSYYLKVATGGKAFDITKTGGGSELNISQNVPFEVIDPRITSVTPTGTDITGRIKTTSGTSLSGNEASFVDKGYENIALNQLNYLDSPRIIASKINEFNLLNNQKSFGLELTLSTTQPDVSPVVNLDTLNVVAISNLVDDKVVNFETDSRPKISGLDPNTAIYETRRINLEFVSNSIFVQFDGHREPEGEFRVFYKLFRGDGDDKNQNYIPFNTNGLPDKTVNPNALRNAFSEYKFTVENTAQFTGFMIKVVMTSTSQAKPPRLKNFRAIALRSFEIDD